MHIILQKSYEFWPCEAVYSICGTKDAPKYKDYIFPLIFAKRLLDDELNFIATEVGSRSKKAFQLVKAAHNYLPFVSDDPEQPACRKLFHKIGERSTTHMHHNEC